MIIVHWFHLLSLLVLLVLLAALAIHINQVRRDAERIAAQALDELEHTELTWVVLERKGIEEERSGSRTSVPPDAKEVNA